MRVRRLMADLMASASMLAVGGAAAMTVPQGESGVVRLRIVNDGDVPLNGVTAQWGDLPGWVRPSESSARVSAGVDGTASLFLSFDVHVAAPPERDVPYGSLWSTPKARAGRAWSSFRWRKACAQTLPASSQATRIRSTPRRGFRISSARLPT